MAAAANKATADKAAADTATADKAATHKAAADKAAPAARNKAAADKAATDESAHDKAAGDCLPAGYLRFTRSHFATTPSTSRDLNEMPRCRAACGALWLIRNLFVGTVQTVDSG